MTIKNCILADWRKTNKSIVRWVILFGGLFINSSVSFLYLIGKESVVALNQNPWESYMGRNLQSFALFFWIPFIILLTSSFINIEHKAKGWKSLFVQPVKVHEILSGKVLSILFYLLFALITHGIVFILAGFIIDLCVPEFEFRNYSPDLRMLISSLSKLFILTLGVTGIQTALSLFFKNQTISFGLGLLGFISGFVLSIQNISFAKYYPFSLSNISSSLLDSESYFVSISVFLACSSLVILSNKWSRLI